MFHAVHLVSSSCDHYNFLIEAATPEEFVEQVAKDLFDFAYIDQVYVDSQDHALSHTFTEALWEAINAASEAADAEDEEY